MAGICTKTGDAGETSLYSGERVPKTDARIAAVGSADELQAALGLARAFVVRAEVVEALYRLQCELVDAMAELAGGEPRIGTGHAARLEAQIDRFEALLPGGFEFDVPGAAPGSAALHVARTVARRCEREVCGLAPAGGATPAMLAYFNRISDLCYVLARCEREGERETSRE